MLRARWNPNEPDGGTSPGFSFYLVPTAAEGSPVWMPYRMSEYCPPNALEDVKREYEKWLSKLIVT